MEKIHKGSKMAAGTWVERELYTSKAFMALRGAAPQALIIFLGKRYMRRSKTGKKNRWICTNRDEIKFSYVEAAKKFGITKARFSRALDDLLAKGFIQVVHKGGGFQQDMSVYAISDKWVLWQKGGVLSSRNKESVSRGFCQGVKSNSTLKIVPFHSNEDAPKGINLESHNQSLSNEELDLIFNMKKEC